MDANGRTNDMLHYCHRYPRKVQIEANHWCGEHLVMDGQKKTSGYLSDKAFLDNYNDKLRLIKTGSYITISQKDKDRVKKIMEANND